MMDSKVKRIGVLTSGGDAPGMNAAVRAVVRTAVGRGVECVGIRRGWNGLINSDFIQMDAASVSHIIDKGGTVLYTARSREFMHEEGRAQALTTCKLLGLDGIVAIGGDGTFRGALALSRQRPRGSNSEWWASRPPSTTTSAAHTIPLDSTPPAIPLWSALTSCGTPCRPMSAARWWR